jgi:hypothetical protein
MSQKSVERYIRQQNKRVARAESDCHATIIRAIAKMLRLLHAERAEVAVRMDRAARGVTR